MEIGGTRFLRIWGFVLVAVAVVMGPLSIFTFGAVCFIGLFVLWLKESFKRDMTQLDLVNGVMMMSCIIWFGINILAEFIKEGRMQLTLLALAFVFPPLIYHLYYLVAKQPPKSLWKVILIGLYSLSGLGSLAVGALGLGLVQTPAERLTLVMLTSLSLLFGLSGFASAALVLKNPGKIRDQNFRELRRVNLTLLVGTGIMFCVFILAGLQNPGFLKDFSNGLAVFSRALPVIFLFFNSYYEDQFKFFDVFVKKATLFFVLLAGLVVYFSVSLSFFLDSDFESWVLPWIFSLTLLPLVMLTPWFHRRLEMWLDRHWLGRSFETAEAVQYFLKGLQEATTRNQLARVGEVRLGEIFKAPVVMCLGEVQDPGFPVQQRVPIGREPVSLGEVWLGPRPNNMPYFAQDLTLASALTDVFWYLLQNLSLQERKQEQEKREQELVLDASRSELKALRAQINPHFLFNALNVIASLVHVDPNRAEATVEQLAEVFRYTLSRSDQEWVRLADEIEFIQAYLEVERARFGSRFEVGVDCAPDARELTIPTMMVQTLVENAVKHGISRVKGQVRLEVAAKTTGPILQIEVRDNGPGFADQPVTPGKGLGYGLRSIRHRLEGYYGEGGRLEVYRDEAAGVTVARLLVPATRQDLKSRRAQ